MIKLNTEKVNEYFQVNTKNKRKTISTDYIGIIEIPKIELKKGFVNPFSIHNNIEENITVLNPVMMPDERNSTFLLAAHSGNSNISFFKDLSKLSISDEIYIYYKNRKYIYIIVSYYNEDKNGTIIIKDNIDIRKIVLTTCRSFDKQLVYIGHLKEIE